MIIDTCFVVDVVRNDSGALLKLEELEKFGEELKITTPTVFELFSGAFRSRRPEEECQKVLKILVTQKTLEFDMLSSMKAGEIDGRLIAEGKKIEQIDSMIASIALLNNETLLTRNVKDFSKIKGLKIESY